VEGRKVGDKEYYDTFENICWLSEHFYAQLGEQKHKE